jgi:EAL domain-containing protein (putative c-di-GMP-specific phosphodiesterase class I)
MSKGKKFSAAEKHFAEKELKLRRELNAAQAMAHRLCESNQLLIMCNFHLNAINEVLSDANEALMDAHKLSHEDLCALLAAGKGVQTLKELMQIAHGLF